MNDHVQPAERVGNPVPAWLVALILVIAVSGWIGTGYAIYQHLTRQPEKIVTVTATCPLPRHGYHILACTMGESDYRRSCRERWKAAGIKP